MSGGGGNVLKVAAPLALGLLLPGVGSAIGAGLTSALGGTAALGSTGTMLAGIGGNALAGAGIGGLGAALTGQKIGKGALLGGIGGGIAGGLGNAFPETFGAATNAGSATAGSPFAYSAGAGLNPADTQHIAGMFDNVPNAITGVSSVASPAASTGGISSLLDSKYLMPALAGGATLLASSGKQQKPTLSRNDAPAHDVAAMERTSMPVDQSVYYGTGGGNRRYLSDTPEVQMLAKGGGIGHLIQGAGDGTSDDIPAMLSDGEYVIPSAVVSALGNGSNKAGAKKLDALKKNVLKTHYKSAKAPKAMGIGSYMQGMAA